MTIIQYYVFTSQQDVNLTFHPFNAQLFSLLFNPHPPTHLFILLNKNKLDIKIDYYLIKINFQFKI